MQVLTLLVAAVMMVVLDQCTKALVRRGQVPAQSVRSCLLVLRYRVNRRAFSGLLSNGPLLLLSLVSVFTGLVAALLLVQPLDGTLVAAALGIAAGGASSNVIDQVQLQGVVDFIDLGWWPVFNLADVAIVVGATSALACFVIEVATTRLGAT